MGTLAAAALVRDLSIAKTPWGSGACLATMLFALGWVVRDFPKEYRVDGKELTVRTWLRRLRVPLAAARRLRAPWTDRLAINGGFGWYGLFRVEGRVVVAFVTDLDRRVLVETGGRAVVISPADVEAFLHTAEAGGARVHSG